MSVQRSYSCDLCQQGEQPSGKRQIFGIYWTPTNHLEIRGSRTVEHHLCRGCIEAIKSLDIPREVPDVY